MNTVRVCVVHMNSKVASRQPSLTHECYRIMLADCFAYQADIVAGDANMSGYRYRGSRQGSASLKDSGGQEMMRYFCRAYNDPQNQDPSFRVTPRFVSVNFLSSLRWWEDAFGQEYNNCRAVNWDTAPTLHCIVCCVLEWTKSLAWSIA